MSQAQTAIRQFRAGSIQLDDPNPALSPEEVKKLFSVNYPHLSSATIEGPQIEGDRVVYDFKPLPAKTKG